MSNYMMHAMDNHYEWLDDESHTTGVFVVDNPFGVEQHYSGESDYTNTGVIGFPFFRDVTPYAQASYLKMSYNSDGGYGCQNVFYLMTADPLQAYPGEDTDNQQYYRVEDVGSYDHDCTNRTNWAISSSIIGFVALFGQWVPSKDQWEMRFGTYLWVP